MNFANIGVPVSILDVSKEALDRGLATVRKNYDVSVKRGRMSAADVEERMKLVSASSDYGRLAETDLSAAESYEP